MLIADREIIMLLMIAILFIIAALSPALNALCGPRFTCWLLALIPTAVFIYFTTFLPQIVANHPIHQETAWFLQAGVNFSFYLDGLSFLVALLITGIGAWIVVYSGPYFGKHPLVGRYYCFLFIFMASMLGLVLADNLFLLFIFWELTTLSSFLLIGFNQQHIKARKAALQALFVTGMGGLALMAGLLLIVLQTGVYELSALLQQPELLRESHFYVPILLLILLGAFTKSAQFPFHFWLPNAMEAPTPISAYLHSATMVKAGVYLLARLHLVLAHTDIWFMLLSTVGGITMLSGAVQALRQTDLKALLAYTTVTALGSLIFLLGSDQENISRAVVAFILAHAMYKAALFMAVGDIQHRTGTRDLTELHGLYKGMPITFFIVLVTAASMSGMPPLPGFYVKELVYEANLAAPFAAYILTAIVVLSNMVTAAVGILLAIKPFFGRKLPQRIKEAEPQMWFGGIFLAVMTIIFSFFPRLLDKLLIQSAADDIIPGYLLDSPPQALSLWHGFTPSLALSVITLSGAIIIYLRRTQIKKLFLLVKPLFQYGPAYCYQQSMKGIAWYAQWQTRWVQCGLLHIYVLIIFLTIAALLYGTLTLRFDSWNFYLPVFNPLSLYLSVFILMTTIPLVIMRSYLIGLVFLALFGMGIALQFLFDGAPDVAMTQVLVETLIVIIVVLNFYRNPRLPAIGIQHRAGIDVLKTSVSILIGLAMIVLLTNLVALPFNNQSSDYFIGNSVVLGHGHNIVNVILVDFRAMDTLGEISVIAIAALGIYGLLRGTHLNG